MARQRRASCWVLRRIRWLVSEIRRESLSFLPAENLLCALEDTDGVASSLLRTLEPRTKQSNPPVTSLSRRGAKQPVSGLSVRWRAALCFLLTCALLMTSLYSKGLTFLTVKGAGHFVPKDRPRHALDMLSSFLAGTPFDAVKPGVMPPAPLCAAPRTEL